MLSGVSSVSTSDVEEPDNCGSRVSITEKIDSVE
jgi:hypothetical protein